MEKIITARHFHLHDDVKQHIHGRLDELEHTYRQLTSARVILDHQKSDFMAEILVRGRRLDVEAHSNAKDLGAAFELAFGKAEKQVHRHFDKVKDHNHKVPISQLECEIEEELMNSGT